MHNGMLLAVKRNEAIHLQQRGCTQRLSYQVQRVGERNHLQNLKCDTKELTYKTETDSQTQITSLRFSRGRVERRINQESGISKYKLIDIKQINNKDLLCGTGNYIQYSGKKIKKKANVIRLMQCRPLKISNECHFTGKIINIVYLGSPEKRNR